MELHSILGGNVNKLHDKRYTLGVGISLGNKWFTVENIVSLVHWSFLYTKDYVIVYVADSIHAINIEVRNTITAEKAKAKADNLGSEILAETKKELEKVLSPEQMTRVKFVKWDEIVDSKYKDKLHFLYKMYESNLDFRNAIFNLVKNTVSKESRVFKDKDLYKLGEYLIEELPEVLCRVQIGGVICDGYAYPHTGEFVQFVNKLQQGLLFPEIKESILDTEDKVFLEVR